MIAVLAGTHKEFEWWCWENRRSTHDKNVRYISDHAQLQGLHGIHFVIVGTFFQRRDAEMLWELAKYAEQP